MTPSWPRRILSASLLATLALGATSAAADDYPPKVGRPHPQIVLLTLEHDRVMALSQLRGKKVLLVHFASW